MKKISYKILAFVLFISFSLIQAKPYVIIISFDGFRWDYVNRGITPNLDRIMNDGVHAVSLRPSFPSKTFPNHISILTGMYPQNHGIISNNIWNKFKDKRYRLGNNNSVKDPSWYQGEFFWETAERNGIKTASFFWPGSEISDTLRAPSIVKKYDQDFPYKNRIDTVITWLKQPLITRPQFITLYFSETDSKGHKYGTDSKEVNQAISHLDSLSGYLYDQIQSLQIKDSVNVIFVSDHGMKNIDHNKVINIEKHIKDFNYKMIDSGPFVQIFPNDKNELNNIYEVFKENEEYYKVYKRDELPEFYHFGKNSFTGDLIVIADLGAYIVSERAKERGYTGGAATHGYNNSFMEMNGLFIANGPAFQKGMFTNTLWNIDIYPLLCEIFKIYPRSNIDGKLERIGFILKN